MPHNQHLETIRQLVAKRFTAMDAAGDCCETLLVRDGFYCGRSFTCDGLRAVWFAEENMVKFFGADGEFLDALTPAGQAQSAEDREAA